MTTKFRSVCGEPAEIKETTSERSARLTAPGQLLYGVKHVFRNVEIVEYEVIAKHEREVYLYPTSGDKQGTYPGKLVGWKSIVFNDGPDHYFEHPEDALNVFLRRKERDIQVSIAAGNKALEELCKTQQDKPSD